MMDQSVAIAIVLLAGAALLLSSVLFIRRYNARHRAHALALSATSSGLANPNSSVSPFAAFFFSSPSSSRRGEIPALPTGYYTYYTTPSRPRRARTSRTSRSGVNRLPEESVEGDELPGYGEAAKSPPAVVEVEVELAVLRESGVQPPGAAYFPARPGAGVGAGVGGVEPPPYEPDLELGGLERRGQAGGRE